MSLSTIALAIWSKLGDNARSNAATTIAVVKCTDKNMYCTSNDVSAISLAAKAEAEEKGISKIGDDYVSLAGAGFHAEMWAVIQAMYGVKHDPSRVKEVLTSVGASRKCCKFCSSVLTLVNVKMEAASEDEYGSWYNPLTVNEKCQPRPTFAKWQRINIPDFRNKGTDYWWVRAGSEIKFTKDPQGSDD
ncbi:MAG: hypothetical protein HY820_06045 [Acidobacteria bacterium]|nr:hypothetical protein [Acidobacteriota bacterium]